MRGRLVGGQKQAVDTCVDCMLLSREAQSTDGHIVH